jgi:hypothetical protein
MRILRLKRFAHMRNSTLRHPVEAFIIFADIIILLRGANGFNEIRTQDLLVGSRPGVFASEAKGIDASASKAKTNTKKKNRAMMTSA